MAAKTHGGNRKVKSPTPIRQRQKRKKSAGGTKVVNLMLPVVFIIFGAFGIWQCMGDDAASPLDPLSHNMKQVDVGENKEADPTLVNESELLDLENMGKPDETLKNDSTAGEPTEDRTIEAAGEELEIDTDAELERNFPLHAVAYHFHTQIFEEPKADARVLAYARRGSTFRVSERVSKKDCAKGWHHLYGGGYICDGKGVNVAREPITFEPSPPAAQLNESMPYEYKFVRRDGVAEYWKLPSSDEVEKTEAVFAALEKRNTPGNAVVPADSTPSDSLKENDEKHDEAALAAVLEKAAEKAVDAEISVGEDVVKVSATEAATVVTSDTAPVQPKIDSDAAAESSADVPPSQVLDELPAYVHLKMAKGYFVSVNKTVEAEGVKYQQTVRGRYIRADELFPAKPSDFAGVLLSERVQLPIAFVVNGGARMLKRQGDNGALKNGAQVDRYSHYLVRGTITRGARDYVEVGDGLYLSSRVVGVAKEVEPPENIGEAERWIDVNLTQQTLVAYEGRTPVFATLISSGRKDFDTPTGEFRIYNKHVSITMDDPDGGEEAYSIEDVPWTQYFEEGYALHAAFWHDRFGHVRSHGCVNLSPADARRLFFWTGPHVNDGVHGVIATADNPGTRVVIHL